MVGRHPKVVFATYADEAGTVYDPAFVRTLRSELAAIGIRTTVVPLRQTFSPAQTAAALARADIARIGGNADNARDPVDYLVALPYLPARYRARLQRIATLPLPKRAAAAGEIAARLQRNGLYLGFSNRATPELFSKRVGCVIDQPMYPGLDVAALCLTGG